MTRRYRDSEAVDFVVVGSGAAGGVMARELAQAGFDVVVLEQGPRYGAQDFEHDELKYWFRYGITNDPDRHPQSFRKTPQEAAVRRLPGGPLPATYARMRANAAAQSNRAVFEIPDMLDTILKRTGGLEQGGVS